VRKMLVASLVLGVALVSISAAHWHRTSATSGPPNIVVILLDDARYDDMSTMTRVVRAIGDQGATFRRFYASFPLCCPARATLFTGEYPHNHGVLSNKAPTGGFTAFRDRSTIATWLEPTYHTGLVGKYFNAYVPPYQPPGWDEWMVPKAMYDYTGTRWYVNTGHGGTYKKYHGYQTDTMGALADDFIARNAPKQEPFFLYAALVAPHAGGPAEADDPSGIPTPAVADRYRDRFAGLRDADPSFNEADVTDKPIKPSPLSPAEIAGLTEANAQRREAELSAQDAVTGILDALRATGELNNTYVIFTSDNGYILGEHRLRGGKVAPYQVADHVPFMVRGPGIAPRTVINNVTAQVDVAPTLLAMAGASSSRPGRIDGVDLLPTLLDPSVAIKRRAVVLEATDTKAGTSPLPWLYHGVVAGRWKYIERRSGHKELYDLRGDPYELNNVAGQPDYSRVQHRLARLLATYASCRGVACR
jgi:N-acetylglucosamine-6-sulfatase